MMIWKEVLNVPNDINSIFSNALQVKKDILANAVPLLVEQIIHDISENKDIIEQANQIDVKNKNGFIIDFNVIENIFSRVKKENLVYGTVTLSQKDESKIYGKQIMDCGNVIVVTDGNPYVVLEMAIRNIKAGNTTILFSNGFMYGTNQLLIQLIQDVLEQFNISRYLLQMCVCDNCNDILSNYANIDLVMCIGKRDLQNAVLNASKNKTILSGYGHFEIYIEDAKHIEILKNIMHTKLDIQLYIKRDLGLDYPGSIIVEDIDEAIAQINYTGSRYHSAIFTNSTNNASQFIREVKSRMVTVNASPTIENMIDINSNDLIMEKQIIYPFEFKISGTMRIEDK